MMDTKPFLHKFVNSEKFTFNQFTEIVAILSIALGTIALILSLSILEGFDTKLRDFSMKFSSHINISIIDNSYFNFYNQKIQNLSSILPDSSTMIQGLSSEGMIKSGNEVSSVSIRAINHQSYNILRDFISDKQFVFDSIGSNGIIISQSLANKLNLKVNNNLIVFTPILSNGIFKDFKVAKFKIKCLYHSGMTQYDDLLAFANFASVAKLANRDVSEANSIQIYLKDPYLAPSLVNKIESYLNYPFYAFTIFDMNQQIFSWIELQKQPIPIILGSITLVATLNIITTLLVLILEKIKSIGILRALGITRSQLLKLILFKGFKISMIGTVIGSFLSISFLYLQYNYDLIKLDGNIYYIDSLPVSFNYYNFLFVIVSTLLLGTAVSVLPAYISVRTEILKALKFN